MDVRAKQRLCYERFSLNFGGLFGGFAPRHLNRCTASHSPGGKRKCHSVPNAVRLGLAHFHVPNARNANRQMLIGYVETAAKKNRGDRKHCWSCSLPKTSASQTDRATENVGVRVGTALFGSSESAFHIDTATYEDSNTSVRTYELQNPIVDRYLDLYRVARFVDGVGTTVKTIGVISGVAILLLFFIIGAVASSQPASPFGPPRSSQSDGVFLLVWVIVGAIIGSFIGGIVFILGVLISAQGQILLAQADAAVHTSPFLPPEEKAKAMSLSSRAVQQIVGRERRGRVSQVE